MAERVRLSEALKDFNDEVTKLPEAKRKAVVAAVAKCASPADPSKRMLATGKVVERFNVDLSPLFEVLPAEMKAEAKTLQKAINNEVRYRGDDWEAEGLAQALAEFITGK